VISFNIYDWKKSTYEFAGQPGKPVIVGEFTYTALDRGTFATGLNLVRDQRARGERYAAFVKDVLSDPSFVGVYWFQYMDQPVTGRSGDGEARNVGFVSITDTPHPELVNAARSTNAKMYTIHAGK
jgi:hypothetical protein